MSGKGSGGGTSGGGLSKEDTKTEYPLQAIVLCDSWGEEQRWGPLVRRKRTDDEEYEDLDVGGEQRPWVSPPRSDSRDPTLGRRALAACEHSAPKELARRSDA